MARVLVCIDCDERFTTIDAAWEHGTDEASDSIHEVPEHYTFEIDEEEDNDNDKQG